MLNEADAAARQTKITGRASLRFWSFKGQATVQQFLVRRFLGWLVDYAVVVSPDEEKGVVVLPTRKTVDVSKQTVY